MEQTAKGILNSLPRAWDMPSIRKKLGSNISPTAVVLLQELERYNQVCTDDMLLQENQSGLASDDSKTLHIHMCLLLSCIPVNIILRLDPNDSCIHSEKDPLQTLSKLQI